MSTSDVLYAVDLRRSKGSPDHPNYGKSDVDWTWSAGGVNLEESASRRVETERVLSWLLLSSPLSLKQACSFEGSLTKHDTSSHKRRDDVLVG